jgi:hypothetical protein
MLRGRHTEAGDLVRRTTIVLALSAVSAVVLSGSVAAFAGAAADEQPSSLVEDYSYPGAAQVEAARGIKLIKGDGHISLIDCGSDPNLPPENLILVQSSRQGTPAETNYCFKAIGTSGLLTMEIGEVYFIRGEGERTIGAKVEVQDATPVVETERVDPGEWQPIGIGQGRGEATLLELRFPISG